MKRVLSIAALVLAGGTLSACGGGAPTDASEEDFCSSFESALTTLGEQAEAEPDTEVDLGDAIDELESTGTPENIPDDAREGYESLLEALNDADGKTVEEVEDDVEDPFGEGDDADAGEALGTYYADTCAATS
ncbi:hypothetical protein INN71_16725 [Nocardioides sp. ChNu-153]|uniref:hypothetical protein n=1 Tax=unclassified Nocardioides TaxID=2615069 RepID=UPI002405F5A1|nr:MULTISPECIES: hypothetical protein [unclassified Nocardioides]MDF9718026.1 hypothetical protein [Nocardioides sp. ChNu-99]MDN7123030.1 hypothetical protein [Nocardioides sp. ChNu-153]